eukprot:scaffold275986_cov28-Tisochrysis_lutea.AAC.1
MCAEVSKAVARPLHEPSKPYVWSSGVSRINVDDNVLALARNHVHGYGGVPRPRSHTFANSRAHALTSCVVYGRKAANYFTGKPFWNRFFDLAPLDSRLEGENLAMVNSMPAGVRACFTMCARVVEI